jgi:hypothetical protein
VVRKVGILVLVAVLAVGSALGVAACGEDREGEVQFEDGTGTAGTETFATGTAGTETTGSGAVETESPETETEAESETAP